MNSKKLLIGGIFLFAFSVWAFKHAALADDADKGIVFALNQWSDGSGAYDQLRCGLPLDESASPQNGTNAPPIPRSKRYIPVSQRKGGGRPHPNGTTFPIGTNRSGKALSERKVMGGKPVEDGDFPWAVAIYIDQIYVCSGTLISKRHVLTAAHCFAAGGSLEKCNDDEGGCCSKSDAFPLKMVIESYRVYLGSVCLQDRHHMDQDCQSKRRQQGFRLANASYFEFFESKCAGNDYALLELTEEVPAEIGNHICMLHLDERILAENWHANAKPVVAFGWGWDPLDNFETSEMGMARLQRLEMPDIWAPESCANKLGSNLFRDDMLCTMEKGDADACKGDSGGGLIAKFADFQGQTRWYLMGTISFGGFCDKLIEGTAKPNAQVYTNVTFHKAVIDKFAGTEDHHLLFKHEPIPVAEGGESNGPAAEEKQKPQEPPAAEFFGCD